jgi:hypothetical protein
MCRRDICLVREHGTMVIDPKDCALIFASSRGTGLAINLL